MQRFALIHDGSKQAWETTYLVFRVAARLGAPLQVLLLDSKTDPQTVAQRANQLGIGGRAAGVVLETRVVPDFSIDTILGNTGTLNGLFLPNHLLPDDQTGVGLLEVLSCPLWIVSKEPKTRQMAVLVENPTDDEDLIGYAVLLSQRMNESLTGFFPDDHDSPALKNGTQMAWIPLQDFSLPVIASALDQIHADLLFMGSSRFSLARGLSCTCVVCPVLVDA